MYRPSVSVAREGLLSPGEWSSGFGSMPSYFMTSSSLYPLEMGGGAADVAVPVDRSIAASKNHREAEKRRRERIKSHLDRLRTLLACDPKTDKATLLAKAVEHVRDLKQRTAAIAGTQLFPTETDEIIVLPAGTSTTDGRRSVFEASVCCEDRSDLLPELMETVRSLRMKTLRAEIATLGGRVRNVLVLAREADEYCLEEDGRFLKDALVELVNRSGSPDRSKRRRMVESEVA